MSENRLETILEGTTYKTALAYLNTLRSIYEDIDPKVRGIDFHLGRISDGYGTDIADSIAVARNVHALLGIMADITDNIASLEKAVDNLNEKEKEEK